MSQERITVVGLGYVGMPVAPGFARRFTRSGPARLMRRDGPAFDVESPLTEADLPTPSRSGDRTRHPMIAFAEPTSPVDVANIDHPAGGLPWVSVVLPIRNEAGHIEACLERLLAQDYPSDRLEILVVDGRSDDGTREVVQRMQARHPDAVLRLLDNPQRTVPPALNVGIRAARGDVIVRMDGHAVPTADYLSACVAALMRSGAANVGGVIVAEGATPFGEAVALATQHPLGAGDAKHWIGGAAGDADTVPFGAFRREVFARVGLFDESMVRNQDYEFNVRLRAAGERIHFDPAIRFAYTPRGKVRSLWSQYFQYGWWKVETLRRHPSSLRWRQAVPPAFVLGLTVALLAAPWSALAAFGLVAALLVYLGAIGLASWRVARPPASPAGMLLAFVVIHFGFSLGFLLNLASCGSYPYRAGPPKVPRYSEAPREPAAEVVR